MANDNDDIDVDGAWWRCARCGLVQPDTYDAGCDSCCASALVETDKPADPESALKTWRAAKAAMEARG